MPEDPRENEVAISVNVVDEANAPLNGVTITWEIIIPGGSVIGSTTFNGSYNISQLVGVGVVPESATLTLTKTGYTTVVQPVTLTRNSKFIWSPVDGLPVNLAMNLD